jgi:predicted RNA-binding protein with PIN domain
VNELKKDAYLLVDGYNIIHAWKKLKKIADDSMEAARDKLLEILSNYAGVRSENVIVVFDAHLVKGGVGSVLIYNNIEVIYTHEAETADSYIEKTSRSLARSAIVRVATSDNLEQMIILSGGAYRVSAREFQEEVRSVEKSIRERIELNRPVKNNELIANLDKETAAWMEKLRRGQEI